MKKRKLKIINFLYLSDEHYEKIRDYRNQEFIREVSLNSDVISEKEHFNYKELLKKKDKYFAYLIICNDNDYCIVTLRKESEKEYTVGNYLVKEIFKYEGAGIANRFCIMYLCNRLNIKYLNSNFKINNTRGHRAGIISKVNSCIKEDGFFSERSEILDINNEIVLSSKAKILFDKLYEIVDIKL